MKAVWNKFRLDRFADFFENRLQARIDLRFHPVMMPTFLLVMGLGLSFGLGLRMLVFRRLRVSSMSSVMTGGAG